MHLLKALASGTFVLASLLWLAIQQILLPHDFIKQFFIQNSPRTNGNVDFLQLKRDWCRVRSKRIAWREMIEPCQEKAIFMSDSRFATNPSLSHISQIIARPAGEHTRVRIDTYTGHGILKAFGGDSIRVLFRGPDIVDGAVFDLQNGSYDALALLSTPGEYRVDVILDYTQCNGFQDPPTEWYVKAHCSGQKNRSIVPSHISSSSRDYINQYISPGTVIRISSQRYEPSKLRSIVRNTDCGFQCKLIWDGYGTWLSDGTNFNQYVDDLETLPLKESSVTQKKPGVLWIYGDSIAYYLHHRLTQKRLCKHVFSSCKNTYNWIYPKVLYEMRHFCEDMDVNVTKVRQYFKEILQQKTMNEESVLLFNLGAHFVKNTSFKIYRDIIDALIEELKKYQGRAIWKSTTAIHEQHIEIMGAFRRYLTSQRVILFNAYANAAMCNAGKEVLDAHPLTASYPRGTKDGVHYHPNASLPVEFMLHRLFTLK